MRHHRTHWSVALGTALVLATTGVTSCGTDEDAADGPTGTTDALIVDQVNAACRKLAAAWAARGEFPFEDFQPNDPDPDVLPDVGRWFESANGDMEALITELHRIDAATDGRSEELGAMIESWEANFANAKDQQEAAIARDATAFVRTLAQAAALDTSDNDTAHELGAEDCVFGES